MSEKLEDGPPITPGRLKYQDRWRAKMEDIWDLTVAIFALTLTFATIWVVIHWNKKQYNQMEEQLKIQNEQLKCQYEQTRLSFYSEYTKRFQEIILQFPENVSDESFSYEELDAETRGRTLRYMKVYFDLCSEEFYLYRKGHLDKDAWEEWEEGMDSLFKRPAFRTAWKKISEGPTLYKDFKKFADAKMGNG
jgi:hypothetical protein